jgi:ribosomal protein L16 Arg81 hydroxylase
MTRANPLERLLSPLTVDEFVGKYFQRAPLRIPGRPNKFDFLFRADEFHIGLDRVSEIRAVFPEQWQAHIRAADIRQMMHAGATICVTGVECAHRRLASAARRIRATMNYAGEVSFRAYLSPPGRGFDLHFDARVATTLQISGTKRWWYSSEPAIPFPLYNSGREPPGAKVRYKVPKLRALRSVLMRPGDLLCLPAGVWHAAKAQTTSLALNMAFDHSGAAVFDSIVGMLRERLMAAAQWREPFPAAPGSGGRMLPQRVKAILSDRIAELERELSKLRGDETALRHAWQAAVQAKPLT